MCLLFDASSSVNMHDVLSAAELQRGVPPPYGEAFSKETLIRAVSSKAFAATTEARIGLQATPYPSATA